MLESKNLTSPHEQAVKTEFMSAARNDCPIDDFLQAYTASIFILFFLKFLWLKLWLIRVLRLDTEVDSRCRRRLALDALRRRTAAARHTAA
jgi:hypothetical protein